jgi:hypothetical protein
VGKSKCRKIEYENKLYVKLDGFDIYEGKKKGNIVHKPNILSTNKKFVFKRRRVLCLNTKLLDCRSVSR